MREVNKPQKMIVAGLDLSINSTGICVEGNVYYNIVSKLTKNHLSNTNQNIKVSQYEKTDNINDNINNIANEILKILKYHNVSIAVIEDVAMGAKSRSIIDLTGLNYWVRCLLKQNNIDFITVPPTLWKKIMLGNGMATKDLITDSWKRVTKIQTELKKTDDLADSYFLCKFYEKS